MTTSTQAEPSNFVHTALFYRSEQQYLDKVVPFITDGLAMGQPVLVAVPADKLALLNDALGDTAAEVTMADARKVARNPTGILGGPEGAFAAKHADRPVRMVGEIVWPERTADEYPACVQHEALVNTALSSCVGMGLCPYDAGELDAGVLADARATHPLVWQAGSSAHRSAEYAPDDAWARYNQPLSGNPMAVTYIVKVPEDLGAARAFVTRYARWLRLSPNCIADLQLIATELATNSLQHTGGGCRLAFWQQDGQVVCEASDSGRLDDPLAGRRVAAADAASGRGLLVVNALADLVRVHAAPSGTTIHAYLRLEQASGCHDA
ncbi:MAG TPA: sensor histidine kinase [Mycobacterium sp.]|nr:sensor histidine kinase [Mycobacterium sp.]